MFEFPDTKIKDWESRKRGSQMCKLKKGLVSWRKDNSCLHASSSILHWPSAWTMSLVYKHTVNMKHTNNIYKSWNSVNLVCVMFTKIPWVPFTYILTENNVQKMMNTTLKQIRKIWLDICIGTTVTTPLTAHTFIHVLYVYQRPLYLEHSQITKTVYVVV